MPSLDMTICRRCGEPMAAVVSGGALPRYLCRFCGDLAASQKMRKPRASHHEGIDLGREVQSMTARGLTAKQMAAELHCSPSYAAYLRKKFVGLMPAYTVDQNLVAGRLASGTSASVLAAELGVSPTFVHEVAARFGVPLPPPRYRDAFPPRKLGALEPFVRHHFAYNPATGDISRSGNVVGAERGGRIQVTIEGRKFLAHRLAWFLATGEDPDQIIDHVDGNPLNNRLANLRLADFSQNSFNRKRGVRNASGVKGVSVLSKGGFRVSVGAHGGSVVHNVQDLEAARKLRKGLAEQLHGEFVRHG